MIEKSSVKARLQSTFRVHCPACGRVAMAPETAIGCLAVCPACNTRYPLTANGETASPPVAATISAVPRSLPALPDPSPAKPLRFLRKRREVPPAPAPVAPKEVKRREVPPSPPVPEVEKLEVYTGPYELDEVTSEFPVEREDEPKRLRRERAILLKPAAREAPAWDDASRLPSEILRKYVVLPLALLACVLAIWSAIRSYNSFGMNPITAEEAENAADPIESRSMERRDGKTTTIVKRKSGKVETKIVMDPK